MCLKNPAFNLFGQNPKYCNEHKLDNMVDVKHQICIHANCKNRPTFNIEGQKPIYCRQHKIEGMINVLKQIVKYNQNLIEKGFQ